MEKKALGRGLDALLPDTSPKGPSSPSEEIQQLSVDRILANPYQPRQQFAEEGIMELADSIKRNGVIQPVIVRSKGDGAYELIAGERRLRAARQTGLRTIPALIRPSSDEQAMQLALVENLQRKDLNAMEEARGFSRMMREFGFTQETLAQRIGKDRSTIANILRLMNLPSEVQQLIESGDLSLGHAKVLLSLPERDRQVKLAQQITREHWSVRQAEKEVAATTKPTRARRPVRVPSPFGDLEDRLQRRLGTRVTITKNRRGGAIVIQYYSSEELDRLVEVLLA